MPRLLVTALLAALLTPAAIRPAPAGPAGPVDGSWSGTLTFRGDAAPVELEISGSESGPEVLVSFPDLVMFREPATARLAEGALVVELPFGIGDLPLAPSQSDGREILHATRDLGGETMTLRLKRRPGPGTRTFEVEVPADGAALPGTLFLPSGSGPHPAVVVLHGSSTFSRDSWSYRSWGEALARRGLAALVYDRRGAGRSGVDPPDLTTLAGDALAAVRLLAGRPEIDPKAVGLLGRSQGGWVAPMAAARSGEVRFLVLAAAAAVAPGDQEVQSAMGTARAAGLGEEELGRLRSYLRLYFYVARSGRGWDLLAREIERAREAPWGGFVDQPERPEQLAWWGRNADVQPAAWLPRVGVPVLAFWGGADRVVPPGPNAGALESLLREGGNTDITVRVLPGADHRLELPMGRDASGKWRWPRVAPEHLDTIEAWIRERFGRP